MNDPETGKVVCDICGGGPTEGHNSNLFMTTDSGVCYDFCGRCMGFNRKMADDCQEYIGHIHSGYYPGGS